MVGRDVPIAPKSHERLVEDNEPYLSILVGRDVPIAPKLKTPDGSLRTTSPTFPSW
jgi:hypothetical protein